VPGEKIVRTSPTKTPGSTVLRTFLSEQNSNFNAKGHGHARCEQLAGLCKHAEEHGGNETISVPTLSLTSFVERVDLRRLDLVKMDIEDAKYDGLVGAGPIIARLKPMIVLNATPEDIRDPFEKR
jgi:hypothetical protein